MVKSIALSFAIFLASTVRAQDFNNPRDLWLMKHKLSSDDSSYRARWNLPDWSKPQEVQVPLDQRLNPFYDQGLQTPNGYDDYQPLQSLGDDLESGSEFDSPQAQSHYETQQELWGNSFQEGLQLGLQQSEQERSFSWQTGPPIFLPPSAPIEFQPDTAAERLLWEKSLEHSMDSAEHAMDTAVDRLLSPPVPKPVAIHNDRFQQSINDYIDQLLDSADERLPFGPTPAPMGIKLGATRGTVVDELKKEQIQPSKSGDKLEWFGGKIADCDLEGSTFSFDKGVLNEICFGVACPKAHILAFYRSIVRELEAKYGRPSSDTVERNDTPNYISRLLTMNGMADDEYDKLVRDGTISCETEWWKRNFTILLSLNWDALTRIPGITVYYRACKYRGSKPSTISQKPTGNGGF